jgi:type IV pilus assembly protein PilB
MAAKTLDVLLVEDGTASKEQMDAALRDQAEKGGSLGAALARAGVTTEDVVAKKMAALRMTKFVDVSTLRADVMGQLVKLVPGEIAHKFKALPVSKFKEKFTFAVVDPAEPALIHLPDEYFRGKPGSVEFWVTTETKLLAALEGHYGAPTEKKVSQPTESAGAGLDQTLGEMGGIKLAEGPDGSLAPDIEVVQEASDDPESAVDEAPVIQLVNKIIFDAVERRASDIHLDATETGYTLRYRMDGVLHDISQIPRQWKRAIAAVIKVKTKLMKIEERRRPQDAKIKIKVPGRDRPVDLRVSTLPVVWGEKIVMRILDSGRLFKLEELGMDPPDLAKLEAAIHMPQGMVLVTGPTGSGKTNTLYSALASINVRTRNIMTAENPVEFMLPGINQVQIAPDQGMTFPAALKAFLRQDPNVILVGEVRDFEEVDIAIKAAMTGHLVLSTLHTNDAPSTVSRLLDIRDPVSGAGVDPAIVASALSLVLAQRLMRRVCEACKKPHTYPPEFYQKYGIDPREFDGVEIMKGEGCPKCGKSGYKGRVGIFEVMRDAAVKEGLRTLRMAGIEKVKQGVSTLEEVMEATIE